MKRLLFLMMIALAATTVAAQPKKSRVQQAQRVQQEKKQGTSKQGMTQRMQLSYPVALDVPEDVVWRRDLYREINLDDEANSGLYYPVQPLGKQMNLFTYIFKLAQNGYIPVYEYNTANDGQDDFSDAAKIAFKTVLTDHSFLFTEEDGKLKVDNSDIPSADVKKYYLKECAYYDQANSSFHIKVLALCPIMIDPDFGPEPLFWVKYSDLEPFLSRQTIKTSDVNDAALMNLDDFFTLNKYKGKIYKTANRLGRTLVQEANGDTTKLSAEQLRIEKELEAFRQNLFGDKARRDSLDSIANLDPKLAKAASRRQTKEKSERTRSRRERSSSSASSSQPARVSVRRERH